MYWDHQEAYASSSQSSCSSFNDSSSTSSFYSNATCGGPDIRTPPSSTRRASLDSAIFEDMTSLNFNTPERQETSDNMSTISPIHHIGRGIADQNMAFPDDQPLLPFNLFAGENFGSIHTSHGIPISTPSLDMDLSSSISCMESCPVSMNFVDPSQTTFINVFDVHSPMRPLQFQSPASDCTADLPFELSPSANMTYHLPYEECKSASTTPSRWSTASQNSTTRRNFESMRSSAALQRAEPESHAVKRARKRLQREINSGMIPDNIRIQRASDKACFWPGCGKMFKRQEHLKRHERTHRPHPEKDCFPCEFCNRPFNRFDNMKAHVERHADPVHTKRTKFYPEAQAAFEAMDRKKKKTKAEAVVKMEGH
jgi:hypothetical protein